MHWVVVCCCVRLTLQAAMKGRTEVLGQAAAILKSLAEDHRIPVLITNQVSYCKHMLCDCAHGLHISTA